jgi:ornithine cyclodeaminase/alanine dehydrogenase-like protein (mu-crystallin family)
VLGAHATGGGFHVKTSGLTGSKPRFVAKVNANFPENPSRRGLPTIQGALILFDAADGRPLAIMDSAEITRLRTAAATAVAAKHLARQNATTLAIVGCGVQGHAHVDAITAVRRIETIVAHDADSGAAERFAQSVSRRTGIDVRVASSVQDATRRADLVVTCTVSRTAFLGPDDVRPGTFVGAVGADSEHKQEIDSQLLRRAVVVADILDQCERIGDLHHAIEAGIMSGADVFAELADVVAHERRPPSLANDIVVFDSTGTALEDVAAAASVYEAATERQRGRSIDLTA